jgi:hypothetical protein
MVSFMNERMRGLVSASAAGLLLEFLGEEKLPQPSIEVAEE